jgi:hypothetical protein
MATLLADSAVDETLKKLFARPTPETGLLLGLVRIV